jgi:hypothetical protein
MSILILATKRATKRWIMALELWDLVAKGLPTLSLKPTAKVFRKYKLALSDAQEKHSLV